MQCPRHFPYFPKSATFHEWLKPFVESSTVGFVFGEKETTPSVLTQMSTADFESHTRCVRSSWPARPKTLLKTKMNIICDRNQEIKSVPETAARLEWKSTEPLVVAGAYFKAECQSRFPRSVYIYIVGHILRLPGNVFRPSAKVFLVSLSPDEYNDQLLGGGWGGGDIV